MRKRSFSAGFAVCRGGGHRYPSPSRGANFTLFSDIGYRMGLVAQMATNA
ncbi:hypothetical protein [Pantoea ananatis]